MSEHRLQLTVNGAPTSVTVPANRLLLHLLRDDLNLTGTKEGCSVGVCGACSVLAATALLQENAAPTEAQVKAWMMGNLCRCTGYYQIVESILSAAQPVLPRPD